MTVKRAIARPTKRSHLGQGGSDGFPRHRRLTKGYSVWVPGDKDMGAPINAIGLLNRPTGLLHQEVGSHLEYS